jgi:RHS repeat-associated protein
MSNRAFARAFCASTALCGVLAAIPAVAQVAPAPPVRQSIDGNGVDLFLGTMNVDGPALMAGQGGVEALSWQKFNRGSGWGDNLVATLTENAGTAHVSFGGISDRFTISGSTYTPTEGRGAKLTLSGNIYTYTAADGTRTYFSKAYVGTYPYGNVTGLVTNIIRPSGASLTFNYASVYTCIRSKPSGSGYVCTQRTTVRRIASVTSNSGYQLSFNYAHSLDYYSDPDFMPYEPYDSFWNEWGNIVSVSGSAGSQSFGYSGSIGTPLYFNITDALGRTTKYRMVGGLVAGITRPGSTSEDVAVTYVYSPTSRVTSIATAAGTTTYGYADAAGVRTTTVTDPLGHATVYTFDIASNRLTSVTNALSQTTSYQYDGSGRRTYVIPPEGTITAGTPAAGYTKFTYDTRGNVTETRAVAKAGTGLADIVTTAGYDASCISAAKCNQPNWTRDPNNNQTDYTYDTTHGGVLTATRPAAILGGTRPNTAYSYTSVGGVNLVTGISTCQTAASCVGTADEVKTTIAYNANLLTATVTQAAGDGSLSATKTYSYDTVGNLTAVDGPLAGAEDTVHARYDAARQAVGMIGPDPDGAGARKRTASRMTYDAKGRVTLAERGTVAGTSGADWAAFAPAESVATSYDGVDRKLNETLIAGGVTYGVTQHSYLGHRLDCSAVRLNPAVWGALPISACTAQTAGAGGPDRISKTGYDNADRVTLVQTAYGVSGEQADEVATSYSSNGKPLTLTDAEGNRTTYEYDGHDRLAKTRYPSPTTDGVSSTTDYTQPSYDANGNVTALRLRDGQQIALTYDALNRVTLKDVPNTAPYEYDVTYSYDLLGRPRSATDSNAHVAVFGYDALGRMTSEQSNWTTRSWQYDLAGRRTRLTWGDGFYVTYDWNPADQLTAIRENGAASGIGVLASYGYDDLGRRTSLTRGNGTVTSYGFDPVSRLSSLGHDLAGTAHDLTLGFSYNPAGQIASSTRSNDAYAWGGHHNKDVVETANGLNQLTAQGGTGLAYDGRGNVSAIGSAAYGYTSENRLATAPGGVYMTHDPLGRYHWIAAGTVTWMQYDGDSIIEERDANGVARRYVHGPGVDEPIVWYEGSGTGDRRWLHADERGSIVAVSNASGVATSINSYDEYGVPAPGNTGRFQYTGQAWLPEIGMYYYKARVYNPKLGRFMQADPIGYGDGMNMYAYVGGDPINGTDPSGLSMLVKWMMSCSGNCGSGYWNTGIAGLGTPAQLEANGWARVDGVALPLKEGNLDGSTQGKTCSGGSGDDIVICGSRSAQDGRLGGSETEDRTKRLVGRFNQLRGEIQNCPGAAASPACKPLWDEYERISKSPEIERIRDRNYDRFGSAMTYTLTGTIAFAGGPLIALGWSLNVAKDAAIECFFSQCIK